MKLSNKDLKILIIIGSILIGVLYYQFGYTPLAQKLSDKKQEKVTIETKYNKVQSDIATLEERKTKVKTLSTKSVDLASSYYPKIIQSKIIVELNEIMEKSGAKGDLLFNPIEVKEVEDITPNTPMLPKTSFDVIVSAVNDKVSGASTDNSTNSANSGANVTVAGVTCEQIKITMNIPSIEPENWDKLRKNLESYDKRIVLNTVTLTALSKEEGTQTKLSVSLNLELYGVPKINNVDSKYLDWDVNKVNNSSGLVWDDVVVKKSTGVNNDFFALLKPLTSEFTTFRMGRSNDNILSTYIYDDKNDISQVELELTEKDGAYYYKYKVGNQSMPESGAALGTKFTPVGEDIVFAVFSQPREGIEDVAGMNLKVINNTKKNVNVVVSNDDTVKPRVAVTAEGGTVNVK